MVVVIVLTAWVGFSTILCLALVGSAANSIPKKNQLIAPETETASLPGLPQPLTRHCTAH